ncbi:MAG: hypothetical protein ACLSTO_01910 [Bilophila wadsworthia]
MRGCNEGCVARLRERGRRLRRDLAPAAKAQSRTAAALSMWSRAAGLPMQAALVAERGHG